MPLISSMGSLSYKGTAPIIDTGLILNYDIQNTASYSGSGATVVDLEGNSNGTLNNAPTYSATGPKYIQFNGSTQYLVTSSNLNPYLSPPTTSTIISFFVWVYPQDNGVILSEQGSPTQDGGWYDSQIEMVSGSLRFGIWNSGIQAITSSIATPLNAWYYVGLTYNGSTLTGYVNGASAGSLNTGRQTPGNNGYNLYYDIAGRTATNMGSNSYANMRLGAFQVYNTALTAAQVLANYNATRSVYGR